MIELRAVADDRDVESYLDVRNRVEPADPVSRETFDVARRRTGRLDLLAVRDARPVGMGFVRHSLEDPDSAYAFARVGVLHDHRRHGVGSTIAAALSRHAATLGCRGLSVEFRGDEADAWSYFGKRGFEKVFEAQEIGLDVGSSQIAAEPPAGLDLVAVVDDRLDGALYEAAIEIERDLPHVDPMVTSPFDQWRATILGPDLLRACSFAAMQGPIVVGLGFLLARPWGAVHGLTGVRGAFRRRGIARAIKSAQIQAARAAGIRELRTSNEINNAPIRRLNESLGYRTLRTWVTLRGPLLGPAA